MPSKRRHTYLFPQKFILLTSFGLCLCAAADILLGVISSNNKLKGYYYRTGFWCGGSIFVTAVLGIVSSCLRSLSIAKSFMIFCIVGIVVSLAVIALSVVGIDDNNTFYRVHRENSVLDVLYHAGLIGIGVVQLVLCILCDIACLCYIFAAKSRSDDSVDVPVKRISSGESNVPLIKNPTLRNSYCQTDDENPDEQDNVKQEHQSSLGHMNDNSSRFSTFGRRNANYPLSNNRIGNKAETASLNYPDENECHYAQILLFQHPLPIEDDDELPPYRRVDPRSKRQGGQNKSSQLRRTNSMPTVSSKRPSREKNTRLSERRGNSKFSPEVLYKLPERQTSKDQRGRNINITKRQSRSSDVLEIEGKSPNTKRNVRQKQLKQDHGNNRINKFDQNEETIVKLRATSLRTDQNEKLNRRRKAYSAEYKFSKENITAEDEPTLVKTSSIEEWNSAMFAPNRIIPTKFSLRTRIRQDGKPVVSSVIPVKPVSSPPPLISPPPKPPRTLLGKNKGFHSNVGETDAKLESQIFVFPYIDKETRGVSVDTNLAKENGKKDIQSSPEVLIESGPVLKCTVSPSTTPSQESNETSKEGRAEKDNEKSVSRTEFKTEMRIPTSPVVKYPPSGVETVTTAVVKSPTLEKTPTSSAIRRQSAKEVSTTPIHTIQTPKVKPQSPIFKPTSTMEIPTSSIVKPSPGVEKITSPSVRLPPGVEIPTSPIIKTPPGVEIPTSPIITPPPGVEIPTSPIIKPPPGVEIPTSPNIKPPPGVEIPTSPIIRPPPGVVIPKSPIIKPTPGVEIPSSPIIKPPFGVEIPTTPIVKSPSTKKISTTPYAISSNAEQKSTSPFEKRSSTGEIPTSPIINVKSSMKLPRPSNINHPSLEEIPPSLIVKEESVPIKTGDTDTIPKNDKITEKQAGNKTNENTSDKGARPKTNIHNFGRGTETSSWDKKLRVPVFIPMTTTKNSKQQRGYSGLYTRPSPSPRLVSTQNNARSTTTSGRSGASKTRPTTSSISSTTPIQNTRAIMTNISSASAFQTPRLTASSSSISPQTQNTRLTMSLTGSSSTSQTPTRNRVENVEVSQHHMDVADGSPSVSQSTDERDALYAKIL